MSVPETETRVVHVPIELRQADADHAGNRLVGYAAMFGKPSGTLNDGIGDFVELIAKGAFARSLRENDIRALFNHDTNCVLGRTKSGTLRLEETDEGLYFEVDLPDTQFARDLRASVERGDIDGCSFGFICRDADVALVGDTLVRTLLDVNLFEVSMVVFPAYESTSVSLRSKGVLPHAAHPVKAKPPTPRLDRAKRKLRMLEI